MRVTWLMLLLVLDQVHSSLGGTHDNNYDDTEKQDSKIRSTKYNVIVSHIRLADCSYDFNFLRADNTPPLDDMEIFYTVDDSVYMLAIPVDTGSCSMPSDKKGVHVNWMPPDGFVGPFDVTGVTNVNTNDGGTVEQHTMDDGDCSPGRGRGDPHMRSFDGRSYSFQGVCWYTLAKHCTENPEFEILVEFAPRESNGTDIKTRAVRLNVTVGDETLSMDTNNEITVNGRRLLAAQLLGKLRNVDLIVLDSRVAIKVERFNLDILWYGRKHAFSVTIHHPDYDGNVCGLLGNADGNPLNDFQMPDGGHTKDVNEFGESWAINDTGCNY